MCKFVRMSGAKHASRHARMACHTILESSWHAKKACQVRCATSRTLGEQLPKVCLSVTYEIEYIEIRDADFKVIHRINDIKGIKEYKTLFNSKVEIESPLEIEWTYKIDTVPGQRWLYSHEGYVKMLSILKRPTYKVEGFDKLNALLGIHNKALKNDADKAGAF